MSADLTRFFEPGLSIVRAAACCRVGAKDLSRHLADGGGLVPWASRPSVCGGQRLRGTARTRRPTQQTEQFLRPRIARAETVVTMSRPPPAPPPARAGGRFGRSALAG